MVISGAQISPSESLAEQAEMPGYILTYSDTNFKRSLSDDFIVTVPLPS